MSGDFKKEEKKKKEKKIYLPEEEKEGKKCPNCHTINELEAKFCAECGYNFEEFKPCPHCGKKIEKNADICKFCGEWILEGKCKFCYADIEEGAVYCGECGSLLKEITCPKCGKLSYFEFCEYCGTPLTPRAEKAFENIKYETKEFKGLNLFENLNSLEVEDNISKDKELVRMKEYIEKIKNKKKKTFTPLFSDKKKKSIMKIGTKADEEIIRQKEERRKKEEERKRQEEVRKKQEEEIKKKLIEKYRKQGTIFLSTEKAIITVKNEDGIDDDTFWLYINDKKIGYIEYPTGGSIFYNVNLKKGINKIELKLCCKSGIGTVASINIIGFKEMFGGSINHIWMVIVS